MRECVCEAKATRELLLSSSLFLVYVLIIVDIFTVIYKVESFGIRLLVAWSKLDAL